MNGPLVVAHAKEMKDMEETVEVFYTAPVVFMKRVSFDDRPRTSERAYNSETPGYINLVFRDRASF